MDIREIQRLHAQFAPDSMVIDLPRQIAALPGPGDVSANESSRPLRQGLAGIAPRARQAAIALAVAAMVAMAGVGAASLYKNLKASHSAASTFVTGASTKGDALIAAAAKPDASAYREVDATPAHPVSAAPALSANDFPSARSLGLTADQFRDSLKAPARSAQAVTAVTAPALTTEAQLAAVSPIHRAGPSRDVTAAAQQPATPPPVAPSQPVAVRGPVAPVQSVPQTVRAAPATATTAQAATPAIQTSPATQQPAEAAKPVRAARHHISRPRAEQNAESSTDARPPAESRAGSAEVKMF
ncbi:hypothetical protein LJ656_34475 [Paraburkholderia sp. MMS20-SJTR3]|uniref:Meckel syndrome type 1 protein n=1 Tax=Paraburkholderia sejongensis TaxID=2886946 RepID=A0ABS8K652_9BURK|nr:hypothetical protein [Paraburkholderia sp. MMS20-SJTR3]MCC8397649.1 hypothetical protein [Paraburkholderia sp. MMS20-SJTR3]